MGDVQLISRRDIGGGTIGGLLRSRSAVNPKKPLLVTSRASMSYGEVDAAADRVASAFRAIGAKKGDAVCLMVANRPEFVLAWFGSARAGLVQVPVNTAYKGDLLDYVVQHCAATIMVVDGALLAPLASAGAALKSLRHVVLTGDEIPADAGSSARISSMFFKPSPQK